MVRLEKDRGLYDNYSSYNSNVYNDTAIDPKEFSYFLDDSYNPYKDHCKYSKNFIDAIHSKPNKLNIKLFRNKKNIGAFGNKLLNIKNCKNDAVYQIDSDNVTDTNLDLVINQINDKNIMYLPSKIYQFRKYKNVSKLLSVFRKKYKVTFSNSDFLYDINVCKKGINGLENVTVDKNINWVLNSGNFFVDRNMYLEVMGPIFINEFRPPLDAVAISYYWLKSEKKIKTLKNLKHFHRKRDDSVSFTENEGSYKSLQDYRQKILNL